MAASWQLKRTMQCPKCPWRVGVDPHQIPNGYSVERHVALASTIATDPLLSVLQPTPNMACHEQHDAHCIGWLMNQLGPGNNIRLRLEMTSCTNVDQIRLLGKQHDCFEDTLPPEARNGR